MRFTIIFKKNIRYEDGDDKELEMKKAREILYDESFRRELLGNRIRFIEENKIEVEVGQGQTMKTDAIFIEIIQHFLINSKNTFLHSNFSYSKTLPYTDS